MRHGASVHSFVSSRDGDKPSARRQWLQQPRRALSAGETAYFDSSTSTDSHRRPIRAADRESSRPHEHWVFDVNRSRSKSRNTPFHQRTMHGAAVAAIVGGRLVYLHPDYSRMNELKHRGASV